MESQTSNVRPSGVPEERESNTMPSAPNRDQQAPAHDGQNHERSSHRGRDRGEGRGAGRGRDRGRVGGDSRGRGGRGGPIGRGGRGEKGSRHRNKEVGRAEWSRNAVDKRARNEEIQQAAKRRKMEGGDEQLPVYATKFSKEEIEAQEKKPKRKVAVMLGYSGSGYKGMQLNHTEKTIEGDLFSAFVAAGAISKANADDPKKSSLIRCARTDKGVHAAGNLISLKLIVEDLDIVTKINEQLSPQIRVWGIERTNGSFSAYQHCDSRIYEYLIPTHCFLPPHPTSFLAEQMVELAEEVDDLEGYLKRQKEVADFWSEAEEKYVKPVIEEIDASIRDLAIEAFYEHGNTLSAQAVNTISGDQTEAVSDPSVEHNPELDPSMKEAATMERPKEPTPLELAVRLLKGAHIAAKKAYRIHSDRLARVRSSLSRYEGSHKFHNYTIEKTFRDPSATRVMKTFNVGETPVIINDTEWLSLKVHGQSFMMHQIRKMVSMVALLVRCGCHEGRIQDSYEANKIIIPKAPSLGLLLERPVFDNFNEKLEQFGRERIDFGKHEKVMEEFKQREIYERIFREEERDGCFHSFFTGLDNARSPQLFYLSSVGVEATKREIPRGVVKEAGKVDIDQISSEDEGGNLDEG